MTLQFEVTNYTDCSKFCGTGRQSRNVTCVRRVGSEGVAVSDAECLSVGTVKPPSVTNCNSFPCPQYVVTPFGPVSE